MERSTDSWLSQESLEALKGERDAARGRNDLATYWLLDAAIAAADVQSSASSSLRLPWFTIDI